LGVYGLLGKEWSRLPQSKALAALPEARQN
jgi:hypothetical protein